MSGYKKITMVIRVEYTVSVLDKESYLDGVEAIRRCFANIQGISNSGFNAVLNKNGAIFKIPSAINISVPPLLNVSLSSFSR